MIGRKSHPFVDRRRPNEPETYRKKRHIGTRVSPVHAKITTLQCVKSLTRQNAFDPRLQPVDHHLQRWAQSQGSGLPAEPEDVDHLASRFKFSPLPDEDAVLTDIIILSIPDDWRRLIVMWYRSNLTVAVIEQKMGMKRTRLYKEIGLILAYLLGRLPEAGVKLSKMRVTV